MSDLRERIRRIKDEEQRMNIFGYSADPYSRQRLENQRGEGTPIAGAKAPRMLLIEQGEVGKWWANDRQYGPFDSVMELELAVLGRSDLQGGPRDPRDSAPKPGDG